MSAVAAVAAAAKTEIVKIEVDPVRVMCPGCGRYIASVLVIPNLLECRCQKCGVDVVALVSRDRTVLAAQQK